MSRRYRKRGGFEQNDPQTDQPRPFIKFMKSYARESGITLNDAIEGFEQGGIDYQLEVLDFYSDWLWRSCQQRRK